VGVGVRPRLLLQLFRQSLQGQQASMRTSAHSRPDYKVTCSKLRHLQVLTSLQTATTSHDL
jgi:hypothetical protein